MRQIAPEATTVRFRLRAHAMPCSMLDVCAGSDGLSGSLWEHRQPGGPRDAGPSAYLGFLFLHFRLLI